MKKNYNDWLWIKIICKMTKDAICTTCKMLYKYGICNSFQLSKWNGYWWMSEKTKVMINKTCSCDLLMKQNSTDSIREGFPSQVEKLNYSCTRTAV